MLRLRIVNSCIREANNCAVMLMLSPVNIGS